MDIVMNSKEVQAMLSGLERDQDPEGKTRFIQTSKAGPVTTLRALGISNPKLRKEAKRYYRDHRDSSFEDVLKLSDGVLRSAEYVEEQIFTCYLLESFSESYTPQLFEYYDRWIDLVDHWMLSDHLSINVIRGYPVGDHLKEVETWSHSENFWRRRQSVTVLLKHLGDESTRAFAFKVMSTLVSDRNYYVRKALVWTIREISKKGSVVQFMERYSSHFRKSELRDALRYVDGAERFYL